MVERPLEHGAGLPEEVRRRLVETAELPTKGLSQSNEGDCRLAVGIDTRGNVILEFGRSVRFLSLPPMQALQIADAIRNRAIQAQGSIMVTGLGLQPPPRG